jgi:hypothetical protein
MTATDIAPGRASPQGGSLLRLRANPLRLVFSTSPWRAAGYLFSHLLTSWILFAGAFTASVTAAALSITFLGAPLLVGAAAVVRGCATAERGMLGMISACRLPRQPRSSPPGSGLWGRARAAWSGRTWADTGLVIGLWAPLYVLDCAVFAIWLALLAGILLPFWYWAPTHTCIGYCVANSARGVEFGSFPHGPHGPGAHGFYVDTLPKALLAAAGFAILFLIFNYVLVLTARLHGQIVRSVVGQPADPLAAAKEVLSRPGPLGPLKLSAGGSGEVVPPGMHSP